MFWRFGGYASISTIETLLDKPDVSLEELLDESELIQELKQQNSKLIEFLREDHVLKRLMDYVIAPSLVKDDDDEDNDANDTNNANAERTNEEASGDGEKNVDPLKEILNPEDLDRVDKNRLKYAYIACEVLSSETWSILGSIMANPNYLREFWGFLRRAPPLDPIQAGYFTKVNETLFDRKTGEMLEFFKTLDGIIPAILRHIDNPMVMDLLLKIISLEKSEGGQGTVDWLKTQDLIPILLSFLSPEHPASVQTSAGDFLKAIITISANATQNDQSCIGPNSLTRQLVSSQCAETLINAMLQGGNPLTVGVGIVIEVIRKNNSDYDPESLGGTDSPPSTYDPIYLGHLLRLFAKNIPHFMALIQSSKHTINDGGKVKSVERGKLNSAWGAKIEPLGFDRFKTCELMAELLHCSNMGLLNEPGSDEYIRQRDAERERLCREGAFNPHKEESSVLEGNDSTADFINESVIDSGSPEDSRVLEMSNAGDDGFENVDSSGVLIDKEKFVEGENHAASEGKDAMCDAEKTDTEGSKNMEEANTSDRTKDSGNAHVSDLTDQLNMMDLEGKKTASATAANESANNNAAQTPEQTSSNPESISTSQSSAKQQEPESIASIPDTAGQVGNTQSSKDSTSDQTLPKDEEEDLRAHINPYVQLDPNGQPVVGDYLKIMFVKHRVVPTILDFFFRFPWNNFLHNVVYDVVQQVFNGPMERGYNRSLAIDLFETGHITQAIVQGQKRSDEAQRAKRIRLGYMGHLTLIAEEVVKFSERHPPELLSPDVMESVLNPEWIDYVEQTLSETRERDNAILGGVRPDMAIGHRQGMLNQGQSMNASSALAEAGLNGGVGNSGFQNFDMMNQGSVSGGAFGLSGGGSSLLSGFGSSSDDEDEELEEQDDRNLNEPSAETGSENVGAAFFTDIDISDP